MVTVPVVDAALASNVSGSVVTLSAVSDSVLSEASVGAALLAGVANTASVFCYNCKSIVSAASVALILLLPI